MSQKYLTIFLLACGLALLEPRPAPAAPPGRDLERAQSLLDEEKPEAALAILDPLLANKADDARALLLRSTARFMLGDNLRGRQDLERSLQLDTTQRQGWLNLAALNVAEKRYQEGLDALLKARDLDPQAPDNDLNVGAVLLLLGQLDEATQHLERHLARHAGDAEAAYLVATNYALAGYVPQAVQHLARAIELDERSRLRSRTDPNFGPMSNDPRYLRLLDHESYQPPAGAYVSSLSFPVAYSDHDTRLLGAVIDALRTARLAFDARIEVTPQWALIWGDLRVKVSNQADGQGLVEVSAPANRFTPAQWQQRTGALFAALAAQLQS